ncbi:MAG: chitobiase/beta-hexosaminidase C-terminal domain-containing protein [Verrucomicrobiales bacterium]
MKKPFLLLLAALVSLANNVKAQSVDTLVNTGLSEPYAVTVDQQNNYYVADGANNRIFKYAPDANFRTNLAGVVGIGGKGFQEGPGFQARFYNPQGIVFARGGLVVADSGNQSIRFVTLSGVVSTLAGTNTATGMADGVGIEARFNFPAGIAADAAGNIYVADLGNNSVRKIDTANRVTTLSTAFFRPSGVAVAPDGRIFVADSGNHSIMVMTPPAAPTRYAGSGSRFQSGYADAFVATSALFNTPRGLLWLGGTNDMLVVADSMNQVVRTVYHDSSVGGVRVGTLAASETARLQSPTALARDVNGDLLIVDQGGNSLHRITTTQSQSQVITPKIGTVALVEDGLSGKVVAKLSQVTSSTFNNDVIVAIASETGTETFYTQDGVDPSPTTGATPPTFVEGDTVLPTSILNQNLPNAPTDVTIKAIGVANGRRSSEVATARFQFQAANPSFIGNNPGAVVLESATTNAVIYYTTDGSEPTQASSVFPGKPFSVLNGTNDVVVKARAYRTGYMPSRVVAQTFIYANFQTSSVGIVSDFKAGVGGNLIVPVNVFLSTNDILRSLQFRVQVKPNGNAPAMTSAPKNLTIDPRINFIQIPPPTTNYVNGVFTREFFEPEAANVLILYVYTNFPPFTIPPVPSFEMKESGIAAVVSVGIPTTAVPGQTYTISVLFPSGTSDGLEAAVPLRALPPRTITIENIPFVAGDSARSTWYNAGDFGNGNLNNNDVNNAFYASVGWRVPYVESDVFRAMNVFGGENPDPVIGLEDWQTIFDRSLRVNTANELIFRGLDGLWDSSLTNLNDNANVEAESITLSKRAWETQVTVKGETVENAQAGSIVRVPVYLDIATGEKVSALQMRASIVAPDGSPRFTGNLRLLTAPGIPSAALSVEGDGSAAYGWPLGSFSPALSGKVLLGHYEFTVPATAKKGDRYLLRFKHCSALYNKGFLGFGVYKAQSTPASIWVDSTASAPADPLSDEWKEHFFGRVDHPLAHPHADPDGDGKTNLEEFLAGVNPAKLLVHKLDSDWRNVLGRGFKLRFLALEGNTYLIESSSDLVTWTEVATIAGAGDLKEFIDNNSPEQEKFYRIRLVK